MNQNLQLDVINNIKKKIRFVYKKKFVKVADWKKDFLLQTHEVRNQPVENQ